MLLKLPDSIVALVWFVLLDEFDEVPSELPFDFRMDAEELSSGQFFRGLTELVLLLPNTFTASESRDITRSRDSCSCNYHHSFLYF
jgi:hypothetical protein